jgi:transcriptional regulator with XRE-family HTH domain
MGQAELADRAGVSSNKVQRYEQANQKPKGDDALALARALGVTADYLLDDAMAFPPPEDQLSQKEAVVRRLQGLIDVLTNAGPSGSATVCAAEAGDPELVRVPVFRIGAGYHIDFDRLGRPTGDVVREMAVEGLGEGALVAAELHGSSMRRPRGGGFSAGEVLVFGQVTLDEVAPGDYAYARLADRGLFRQVFFLQGRVRLRALNPADPEVIAERREVRHVARLLRRIKDY